MLALSRASLASLCLASLIVAISGTEAVARKKHPDSVTLIHSMTELQNIRKNLSGNYQLANNIDATNSVNFVPIGNQDNPFTGTLNGNGFSIANLSITSASAEIGLFGEIAATGTVRNLALVNADIIAQVSPGKYVAAGALVGFNAGTIILASVTGAVTAYGHNSDEGGVEAGGLIGFNTGIVQASSNAIVTTSDAHLYNAIAGGLVGYNARGQISQSVANGLVAGGSGSGSGYYSMVGGLVGQNAGTVQWSFASGRVTARDNSFVGGLAGASSEVVYDSAAVLVQGGEDSFVGGLIGSFNGWYDSIRSSYATGNVSAANGSLVGGLIGDAFCLDGIVSAYATGAVHAIGQASAGGLVGGVPIDCGLGGGPTSVSGSYSTGKVVSDSGVAGGLIGTWNAGTGYLIASYWDLDTSGISDPIKGCGNEDCRPGVSGLKSNQFKSGKLPAGFDDAGTWMSVHFPIRLEGVDTTISDYPRLWALPFPVMSFPLLKQSAYGSDSSSPPGARIISVLDHSLPWQDPTQYQKKRGYGPGVLYRCDDYVLGFSGAVGQRNYGTDDSNDSCIAPGYAQDSSKTAFVLGGVNYKGNAGDNTLLNYDGHPGYDYAATYEPVFAATSGTVFYPLEAIGMGGNPYHAYCFFHAMGEVPDAASTYRLYYLHLRTHPAGMEPFSPHCNSEGDTKGHTADIQPGWIATGCIYKDQNGSVFTPKVLPLKAGTHVDVPLGQQCVVAQSGSAGVPAPHLHFEMQQMVPLSSIPGYGDQRFINFFKCYNEDTYDKNNRDKKSGCVPVDPYGWTGTTTSCSGDIQQWHESNTDVWACLTGIPSRRFWAQ